MVTCPVICKYDKLKVGAEIPLNYHVGFTACLEKDLIFRPQFSIAISMQKEFTGDKIK